MSKEDKLIIDLQRAVGFIRGVAEILPFGQVKSNIEKGIKEAEKALDELMACRWE